MKLENENLKESQIVWICDFRYNDIFKKPIRNVKPTKVMVKRNIDLPCNKTVYYSDTHFRTLNKNGKISSKVISLYDNTGYRSYEGICVNIFDNEKECKECFEKQCEEILKEIQEAKEESLRKFNSMEKEIISKLN